MNKIKKILAFATSLVLISGAIGCTTKPVELSAPEIKLTENVVSWNAVDKAEGYIVTMNSVDTEVTATSYTINATTFGDYSVQVKAFAKDKEARIYSPLSNKVTYHKDLTLSAPVITLTGSKVTWPAVANASKYEVFVNGTSKGEQAELAYTINETAYGDYKVTVKAIGMDGSKKVISNASNEVSYHVALVLAAPVIALNENVVSWTAVANATQYEVFVNGTSKGKQEGLSYTISETSLGSYAVKVKAVGMDGTTEVKSDFSNEVSYTISLAAPVISLNENVVSWEAVTNATKYEVFVNGNTKGEQTDLSYTITDTAGIYKVTVKSVGMEGTTEVKSVASNEVSYKHLDLTKPFIAINRKRNDSTINYIYGKVDQSMKDAVDPAYQERLEKMDNYIAYLPYTEQTAINNAWQLETVSGYDMTKSWVYGDEDIYRIRLTDGKYLTCAKNNYVDATCDYVSSSEYYENDIWQYWQILESDTDDRFYLYNVGHGYDWNKKNDYITDTSKPDGGMEFWTIGDDPSWYLHEFINVDTTVKAKEMNDYTGSFKLFNIGLQKYVSINGDSLLSANKTSIDDAEVFTLTKGTSDYNDYKIATSGGLIVCMDSYQLKAVASSDQTFIFHEFAGVKNGVRFGGYLNFSDFCWFTDGTDGCTRHYLYSTAESGQEVLGRFWGAIDHRNDSGNYFQLIPVA